MIWRHFSFTIFWALLVLLLYGIPGSDMPNLSMWNILEPDKVAHCGVFAVLVCSLSFSIFKQHKSPYLKRNTLRNSAVISIIYGTILELIQGSVFSERHTDIYDIIANTVGVLLGIVILRLFFRDILS